MSGRVLTLWVTVVLGMLASYATAQEPTSRPALPDAAAQAKAEKSIREVYRKEYGSRNVADRRALARRLLQQAAETADDPAARYVLLRESRDIAASAGDASTASAAIRQLDQLHSIQRTPMLIATLTTAIRTATDAGACASASRICLQAADEAILVDDHASAGKLITLAESAAQRARNVPMLVRAQARAAELKTIAAQFLKLKSAKATIEKDPDDPAANLAIGQFLCLVKGDWTTGLPHLSKGPDEPIAALARIDASRPLDAGKAMELANGWWDLGEKLSGLARKHAQRRAVLWYRQAADGLTGLNRSVAQKRVEAFEQDELREMNLEPGLAAELYRGPNFNQLVKMRVDPQADFDWSTDAPDPALPKDNFSIRWTGTIKPPAAGRYELTLIANAGARLWIDEKLAIDGSTLLRSRNGAKVSVELSKELHSIRLDYWDTTGLARLKLLWQAPGTGASIPIPATAFYHDASTIPPN